MEIGVGSGLEWGREGPISTCILYASAFASGRRSSAASASAIGSTPFCEASHLDRASALLSGPREDLVRR